MHEIRFAGETDCRRRCDFLASGSPQAGARDLGGISLVNVDEVNPSFAFPSVADIRDELALAGYTLQKRTPVDPALARIFLKGAMLASCIDHERAL